MIRSVSEVGGDGIANYCGTNSPRFSKDGNTSYLGRHSTWVFASSVHTARQLQTCWHTHLPFLSSSIIMPTIFFWDITAEEEGIILALEQPVRIRRVRLDIPAPNLQKLIMTIGEEYPELEYLIMAVDRTHRGTALTLPEALQAPHLRHLALTGFALPVRPRLLTTAVSLVTLALTVDHPSAYFQPNILLQWLSFMPQLETLVISFSFPVPNRDVQRQVMRAPIVLPKLRSFELRGVSAYVEAVVRRITAPRLEKLGFQFFKQLTFSVPSLLQFMGTTENLRFNSAKFDFSTDSVHVKLCLREEAEAFALSMFVDCWHLDWQISSVAQIFNSLVQIFSKVEHLTLEHGVHGRSSEEHNEADRAEWRKLLSSFSNVKTFHINDGLVEGLPCSLRLGDGEHPLELLPELQELTYCGNSNADDAFTSFIDTRQNAGRPVTLRHSRHYFIDSYISCTFTPQNAEGYLVQLLKVRNAAEIQAVRHQSGAFYVFNRPPHNIPSSDRVKGKPAWLLDYAVRSGGSIVRQQLLSPQSLGDRRRYVEQTRLRMPVFFVNANGGLGVPVSSAAIGEVQLHSTVLPPQLTDRFILKIRIGVYTRSCYARISSLTICVYRSGWAIIPPNIRSN